MSSIETCLKSDDIDFAARDLFQQILRESRARSSEKMVFLQLVNMRLFNVFIKQCLISCHEVPDEDLKQAIMQLLGELIAQDYPQFQLGSDHADPSIIIGSLIGNAREQQ